MRRRIPLIILAALVVLWLPLVYLLHPGDQAGDHVGIAIQVGFTLFMLSVPVYLIASAIQYFGERPVRLRNDRIRRGQCLECGYDLQGNLSGRCPECGLAVIEGVRERPTMPGVSGAVFAGASFILFLIILVLVKSC